MKRQQIPLLILTGLAALSVNSIQATELSYLYKDQRIMAMGGANVAAGGYSSSLFSNPAGIAKVSNNQGVIIELLGVQASVSKDARAFVSDLNDAIDSENTDKIDDVLANYSGESTHADISNYSSITNNHGQFAWSLGLLNAVDANLTSNDNQLEIQARSYGGITGAMASTFQASRLGNLSLGLGLKVIAQKSYEDVITSDDLIGDDISEQIADDFQSDGTAMSVDIGAIYQYNTYMKPSLGVSVLNIGELDFDNHYGSQPMTVNFGASIQPNLIFAKKTVIAIDYVDAFNANETKSYDTSNTNIVNFISNNDISDRIRLGASALLYDNIWSSLELAAGLYQGAYTAGFTFTAGIFRLGFTTYEDQVNSQLSTQADRRYILSTGIVW